MTGLVGWWPLCESDGDASDYSGQGNAGTVSGAGQGVAGRGGLAAYSFDGADDYVSIPSRAAMEAVMEGGTVAAWIQTSSSATQAVFGTTDSGANTAYDIRLNLSADSSSDPGGVRAFIRDEGDTVSRLGTGDIGLNDGAWHHIAVSHLASSSEWAVYVDGASVSFNQDRSGNPSNFSLNLDPYIGARHDGDNTPTPNDPFDGLICDFRLYNRILTAAEAQTLYEWGSVDVSSPPEDGVAYYPLDGDGTDAWGSNDATVNGATVSNGLIGQCYDFDGSDDYLDLGTISEIHNATAISFGGWINAKWDTNDDKEVIGATTADFNNQIDIMMRSSGNNVRGVIRRNGTTANASFPYPPDDVWIHVFVVFSNSELKLYKNAELMDTGTGPSQTPDEFTMTCMTRQSVNRYVDGLLDDVRFYDRALTPAEIFEVYRYGSRGILAEKAVEAR